jgi:hypothetical protein
MGNRTYILLIVGISLLITTSQAPAQEEQWLQYHSTREARQIIGDMSLQTLEISTEKPASVELPQFKGQDQFFAKWSTPMVKSGHLWISLDRTHKKGLYDLLYIDSNRNGHLNDETAVAAYRMDQYNAYFGPVKVVFEVEDGPVTYHLNFRFYNYNERNRRLYASSGGWYEGDVTVGGAKKHCVLIDYNTNGTFDDKSLEASQCDRVRIGKKGSQDTRFVGNYIEVDGELYRPEIARDGACIKLSKAEDVKFGNIRLPESITEFSACGENGLFTLKPEKGAGSLPVGKYRINSWAVERKDEKGAQWKLQGSGISEKGVFDITADKETELSVGEPIVSTLETSVREGTHNFNYSMKGRDGERIELTRNGARPQAPKVHIKSKDGTYDRTFSFQYG